MAYRVLIPQDIAEEGKEYLRSKGYEIQMGNGWTEADLIRDVADCDAVLLRTAEMTAAVLEAGKRLKIVARHGAGYNNVDLKRAEELGIWVTNTPDVTTDSVSEYAMGGIVMMAKRIFEHQQAMKQGDFFYKNSHKGTDLKGKVLGIVGIGRIGQEVARKAYYGFDMKIVAYAPRKTQTQVPEYVRMVTWNELFQTSDFVTVHVPLTEETKGFIKEEEFAVMKPTANLINCSRGGVVSEKALIKALQKKQIAGVFTDVMEEEPPENSHPFFTMNNVVVTPHMASNTTDCMRQMAVGAAMQIDRVLSGKVPDYPVNCVKY